MGFLLELDRQILLFFNGSDSLFLDGLIVTLTSGYAWIPLYVVLFYVIMRDNETVPQIMLVAVCAIVGVALTAGITNFIVKPLFERPRPCNDPAIKYLVDTVITASNKDFSFFSAHAANTSVIAAYLSLMVRNRMFTVAMSLWVLLSCYTRLYLGMHYLSDILVGLCFGILMGMATYRVYQKLQARLCNMAGQPAASSSVCLPVTAHDIDLVITTMVLIFSFAVVRASVY